MTLFYQEGSLTIGERGPCSLLPIAEATQGPFYLYHLDDMLARVCALRTACPRLQIHYAMKANLNPHILRAFAHDDIGADVVSLGEINAAIEAGFNGNRIIFSGVAKSKEELEAALKKGLRQINIESLEELTRLAKIARSLRLKAPVAFRFNPDVDANTHPYIATGLWNNKFGIDHTALPDLVEILKANRDSLSLQGISIHIGSQIGDLGPIEDAILKTLPLFEMLRREDFTMTTFDIGGGLGVDYQSQDSQPSKDFARLVEYSALVNRLLGDFEGEIFCEPGRILVGRSGVLVAQVEYVKKNARKSFLICNTGVHHFPRPALYNAYHRILPLTDGTAREKVIYDVVGPLCESSDVLGADRELPSLQSGDYIAIADAGAYGMVMASRYNHHELPAELVWSHGKLLT